MVHPLPSGVSGLVHPNDEPYINSFESCAELRRRLGLPSYTREDLELLFEVKDAPAPLPPAEQLPRNVIRFPVERRPRRRKKKSDAR